MLLNRHSSRTYDFKDLPLSGCVEVNDATTGSSHCYGNRELISYDTIPVIDRKAAFIDTNGLGGAMFWESSMDGTRDHGIIPHMAGALGSSSGGLDRTPNRLAYPDSPYDNISKCPQEPSSTAATSSGLRPSSTAPPKASSITTESPTASSTCSAGPALYNYQGLHVCMCGLDVRGQPNPYDPEGLYYENNCNANNATSACGKNKACIPGGSESALAYCAEVIDGCQDFPEVTEIDYTATQTRN